MFADQPPLSLCQWMPLRSGLRSPSKHGPVGTLARPHQRVDAEANEAVGRFGYLEAGAEGVARDGLEADSGDLGEALAELLGRRRRLGSLRAGPFLPPAQPATIARNATQHDAPPLDRLPSSGGG